MMCAISEKQVFLTNIFGPSTSLVAVSATTSTIFLLATATVAVLTVFLPTLPFVVGIILVAALGTVTLITAAWFIVVLFRTRRASKDEKKKEPYKYSGREWGAEEKETDGGNSENWDNTDRHNTPPPSPTWGDTSNTNITHSCGSCENYGESISPPPITPSNTTNSPISSFLGGGTKEGWSSEKSVHGNDKDESIIESNNCDKDSQTPSKPDDELKLDHSDGQKNKSSNGSESVTPSLITGNVVCNNITTNNHANYGNSTNYMNYGNLTNYRSNMSPSLSPISMNNVNNYVTSNPTFGYYGNPTNCMNYWSNMSPSPSTISINSVNNRATSSSTSSSSSISSYPVGGSYPNGALYQNRIFFPSVSSHQGVGLYPIGNSSSSVSSYSNVGSHPGGSSFPNVSSHQGASSYQGVNTSSSVNSSSSASFHSNVGSQPVGSSSTTPISRTTISNGLAEEIVDRLFGAGICSYAKNVSASSIDYDNCDKDNGIPSRLVPFVLKKHGISKCSSFAGTAVIPATDSSKSVYERNDIKIKEISKGSYAKRVISELNDSVIVGDISCVSSGTQHYYISCSPMKLIWLAAGVGGGGATITQFFTALYKHFESGRLIIVDTSSPDTSVEIGSFFAANDYPFMCEHATSDERDKNSLPPSGIVTNVASCECGETEWDSFKPKEELGHDSIQKFSLSNPNSVNDPKRQIFRLRIPNFTDASGLTPERAQELVDLINSEISVIKANMNVPTDEPISILSHCSAGAGRSPSIVIYHAIDAMARTVTERGGTCCCDFSDREQMSPAINFQFNLAWGLRVFLINGLATRSVFGQTQAQFMSFRDYAKYRAKLQSSTQ